MSSQYPSSSTTTTTTHNSPSPSPRLDPSSPSTLPVEEDLPDLDPPSSPKHGVIASPPLDTRPYSPHGVGIGILSPQPVLGPFAPISRASFAPLQVKSSPVEQRSNPLESAAGPRHPITQFEPLALRASGSRSPELPQPSPPPIHALGNDDDALLKDENAGEHIPLTTFSSAGTGQVGLRIAIPPPNPTSSSSTPSPPLLAQHAHDPAEGSFASVLDPGTSGSILETPGHASVDLLAPSGDLNIDFTEFDTEGYSALEKIYLFSRSRASFHRVFIAHALPRYLLGAETSTTGFPSEEATEHISPGDAVEYILPLLNGLATDEEPTVQEALAAELVPIIWWFLTHCRLVEDDALVYPVPPSPPAPSPLSAGTSLEPEAGSSLSHPATPHPDVLSSDLEVLALSSHSETPEEQQGELDEPTAVSVQAFTPMLGTLLLSPNGIVGGSARYAVVELLRRLRRADERDDDSANHANEPKESAGMEELQRLSSPTPSQSEYQDTEDALDIGFLYRDERRLFEHELVYQVVIGMGRLDMDENRADTSMEDTMEAGSDSSTAVPTPHLDTSFTDMDSYFPRAAVSVLGPAASSASVVPATSPPAHEAELAASSTSAVSPVPSPSPPISSTSSLSGSPGHSSSSTPSLTSSTSSSSGEYPDNTEFGGSEGFGPGTFPLLEDVHIPVDTDEVSDGTETVVGSQPKHPMPQNWIEPSDIPRHAMLPTATPFEVPPPPPVAAPFPVSAEATSPITGIPLLQVQPSPAVNPVHETSPRFKGSCMSPRSAGQQLPAQDEQQPQDDGSDLTEEASVGRLSSMSLMAAVTASGSIGEDTKKAFVAEVERVGRDAVFWVRREASFAVGALAKVVPVEVVTSSLLPLFETLCHDSTWHVRHSVLFALPAILSRLTPERRRRLALDVILPLSQDEESTVRSAVLEALGEVMHTFADDEGGPPDQLLRLFLGIREIDDPGGGPVSHQPEKPEPQPSQPPPQPPSASSALSSAWSDYGTDAGGGPDIYDDPQRPLVCAFNYPAVALTLGRRRWPELRSLYLSLVQDPSFKTRRTLAASLGEIAKIIGEEHARADLIGVFWSSLQAEESEVRMKLIEALPTFVRAIGQLERAEVSKGLVEAFSTGKFSSWREREAAVTAIGGLAEVEGVDGEVLRQMLIKALDDRVAAIREAAVAALPDVVRVWKMSVPALLEALQADVREFATSPAFRKRTTWVLCIQQMLTAEQGDVEVGQEAFWETLSTLVDDPIVDVRIRVARLLGLIFDKFGRIDSDIAVKTIGLARDLTQDASHEVQAFAKAVLADASPSGSEPNGGPAPTTFRPRVERTAATFSRPPPPTPS